jgi:ParB family chromosome partitioning protein
MENRIDQIEEIELKLIDRPEDPARTNIDANQIRELAESIRELGLRAPILIRPRNGRYEIVAGDRRFLAHKLIQAKTIKSIVNEMTDEEVLLVRAIENDQREDLTVIEKAKQYERLRDRLGMTLDQIAKRMGRNIMTIHKYLKILKLPEEVQTEIDLGKISIEAGFMLGEIEDGEFRSYYLKAASDNGATAQVVRTWVDAFIQTKENKYYDASGGGGGGFDNLEPVITWLTCDVCVGPVDARLIKYIKVCKECVKKVKGR